MLNDFGALDYVGHELSDVTERWCYDCDEYTCLDTIADHDRHDVNTTVERYCFNCDTMHTSEETYDWATVPYPRFNHAP